MDVSNDVQNVLSSQQPIGTSQSVCCVVYGRIIDGKMVSELSYDFLLLAAALIARLPSDTARELTR